MDEEEKRLDRLSELLNALPVDNFPMTISELDGYVTGILACPEMIPPSEWLSEVWGETGEAQFANQKAAEETIGAVMTHYNSVAEAITRSLWIEPIYEVDPNSDETLWEPWVDGFIRAMRLRTDAWESLLDRADEETRSTMIFLMALQDIYTGKSKFTEEEIDELDIEAPDLIPNCVAAILHQSRPELAGKVPANLAGMPHKAVPRPGRNEPCTCGSGRKYKQCCGRN
ncbi:MAG: UPF0149 family protein [Roseovarius sp.]|nr:UPF0149 family protein [Roseovarius sp.]